MTRSATVAVDSSAIVAVLKGEPDSDDLFNRALAYDRRVISAATWLESATVCEKKKPRGGEFFDSIVEALKLEILPFTITQATIAREAFSRYGKGRAALNLGDFFTYALAKDLSAPLLFKGNDFARTDIERA